MAAAKFDPRPAAITRKDERGLVSRPTNDGPTSDIYEQIFPTGALKRVSKSVFKRGGEIFFDFAFFLS